MTIDLGVDIGGTKIQFCRVDETFNATSLGRTPTALMRRGTWRFAEDLAELIRANRPPDCRRVGVSLNGVLNNGTVVYSSLMGGRVDFPLREFLADRLGCPVAVDDDIHAMTLAEAELGSGRDTNAFAMLNLGTGIGVGCFDGHVVRGRYAAGLISEQKIHVEELSEYRSLDRTVCGRGMREIYRQLTGEDADAVTIFAKSAAGKDKAAQQTVDIFTHSLSHVLQMISRFYHPASIILNGSIRGAAPSYLAQAVELYRHGLDAAFEAEIIVSTLDHAAELGTLVAARHGIEGTKHD
jgi:glucokinase